DDLSYARTFYKNRSVRVYLNGLAQSIFTNIYKNKKSPAQRFTNFWKEELPKLVYDARQDFLLAFLIFLAAFTIGALSTAMDSEFPRIILGDSYVDMTIENIKKGDPMAVYKEKGQFGMSVGITLNNILVALRTFVLGVFAVIGSIGILLYNGVMVGAFQYFFYDQGVFLASFLTIWMHGTLEISAIIIAGAAGITMGKGWIFPGTLSRLKSFQTSARRGLKIMMGLIPIFIAAGFIEGYITRYTEVPDIIRATFILLCLIFVLWYFVWYPWRKAKTGFKIDESRYTLQPDTQQAIDFGNTKKVGRLFADTIIFFRNHFWRVMGVAFIASLIFTFTVVGLHQADNFSELFYFQGGLFSLEQFFIHDSIFGLSVLHILLFTGLSIFYNQLILEKSGKASPSPDRIMGLLLFVRALVPITLIYLLINIGGGYTTFFLLLLFPVIWLWLFTMQREKTWYIQGLVSAFNLMGAAYTKLIGTTSLLLLICAVFFGLLNTSLTYFFIDMVNWNLPFKGVSADNVLHSFLCLLTFTVIFMLYGLLLFGVSLYAFGQSEVKTAEHLKAQIQQIGRQKKLRGMAVE
ncbi:MAG: stage II sporulation protein M, partial [Bacteroidota bacterium]